DSPEFQTMIRPNGTIIELGYAIKKKFADEEQVTHLKEIYGMLRVNVRWPNIIRHYDGYQRFILIDFDYAGFSPSDGPLEEFSKSDHAPEMLIKKHDFKVDIWGVGNLVNLCNVTGIPHELLNFSIDLCNSAPIAKLDDDTASYKTNSDDTPEQIKNISNNISNSDIFRESNIQYSEPLIHTESESSENKEIKFLNRVHRETVSNEIKERNREKKLQAQNSLSYNKDNSSCDIKTVSQGNDRNNIESSVDIASQISNQQKTIPNTPLPAEDLDNSDEIELTKNQNIELDLIQDLRNCMLIVSPDPIEIPFEDIADSEKPSSKITTQSLIHLFKKAIRSGHQEILSWICYSDNFENKVIEIRHKAGVNDKTARTQIYKEMLEHLPGVTSVALRIKTLRARKIRKLFGENGVGIDKVKYVTCSANDISKLTNAQIQNIINQVTSKTVSLGNDQNHVTETEASITNIPSILLSHTSNSEYMISKDKKSLLETKVSVSSNPAHSHAYFRNKTLDQYPNLYREGSDGNDDYYGITDESLCPLCKLDHDDDNGIGGRYEVGESENRCSASSYYIKCEQRGIEIEAKANKTLTPEYLEWEAKLTELPGILTDKIRS
ncbi:10101_t:CDS:2, partial [Racocetra fulgida]